MKGQPQTPRRPRRHPLLFAPFPASVRASLNTPPRPPPCSVSTGTCLFSPFLPRGPVGLFPPLGGHTKLPVPAQRPWGEQHHLCPQLPWAPHLQLCGGRGLGRPAAPGRCREPWRQQGGLADQRSPPGHVPAGGMPGRGEGRGPRRENMGDPAGPTPEVSWTGEGWRGRRVGVSSWIGCVCKRVGCGWWGARVCKKGRYEKTPRLLANQVRETHRLKPVAPTLLKSKCKDIYLYFSFSFKSKSCRDGGGGGPRPARRGN